MAENADGDRWMREGRRVCVCVLLFLCVFFFFFFGWGGRVERGEGSLKVKTFIPLYADRTACNDQAALSVHHFDGYSVS